MFKSKKRFVLLIIIIIVVFILFLTICLKSKYLPTETDLNEMLKENNNISNMFTSYKEVKNDNVTTTKIYVYDNLHYAVKRDNDSDKIVNEYYYDSKTSKLVTVNHTNNTIIELEEIKQQNFINGFLGKNDFYDLGTFLEYKYLGKEKVNEIECIKVCFLEENYNKIDNTYFYIDVHNKNIIKMEVYQGNSSSKMEKIHEKVYGKYVYGENVLSDIPKFDINNYPNFFVQKFDNRSFFI